MLEALRGTAVASLDHNKFITVARLKKSATTDRLSFPYR